ncbi:MAG: FkbM family methyltransferase [Opitutae bacterium]|nr:FkbM family methyltransferase [Opitutae bacterium]
MLKQIIRSISSRIRSEEDVDDSTRTIWKIKIDGMEMSIVDHKGSQTPKAIFRELIRDELGLLDFRAPPMPVIIDIGANTGIISILMGKRFPNATIYGFEPLPRNFENLKLNLEKNQVQNVKAFNLALTSDGRELEMTAVLADNSGGSTANAKEAIRRAPRGNIYQARSITLDSVFHENGISSCDLLKIDCEGSEHEILGTFSQMSKIGHLIGEIHFNRTILEQGHDRRSIDAVLRQLGNDRYRVKYINMCE